MRVLLVIVGSAALLACAAREPAGPAWPRAAERDSDGGESLAPRAAARAIAAVVEERAIERAAEKPAAPAPPAATAAAPAASGTVQVTEEPLPLDEMVIEIDD